MKKRTIILSTSAVIILALAIGVAIKFSSQPTVAENKAEPIPQATQEPVVVNINNAQESTTTEPTAEPTSVPEQAIPQEQENVPIPAKPTAKPNPPKSTGSYTNPDAPPKYSEKETVKEPSKETPQPPKESAQDTKGKKYVEGFGYVDIGGPNHEETADAKGDINKQVGNMD